MVNGLYYGFLSAAVAAFGFQFFCGNAYRERHGSGFRATFLFGALSSAAGILLLLLISGACVSATPLTLATALASAVNSVCCTVCGQKALGKVNLSLYSLFMMLGGMAVPFAAGILFFGEPLTAGGAACMVFLVAALLVSARVRGEGRGGLGYCAAVFVFNGLAGVIAKLFYVLPYERADAASLSLLTAAFVLCISLAGLLFARGEKLKLAPVGALCGAGNGLLNTAGNFLLLLALAHLPASVQYPFVTGGVIIVSTLLSYLTPKKAGLPEWIGAALAFAGIAALLLW